MTGYSIDRPLHDDWGMINIDLTLSLQKAEESYGTRTQHDAIPYLLLGARTACLYSGTVDELNLFFLSFAISEDPSHKGW